MEIVSNETEPNFNFPRFRIVTSLVLGLPPPLQENGLERSSDAPSPNELTARSESGYYAPGRALFLYKWDKDGLFGS